MRNHGPARAPTIVAPTLGLTHRPAWQEISATKRLLFDEPAPVEGIGADAAYARFRSHILPYGNGNWHPRFFGWVQGQGKSGLRARQLSQ